MNYEEHIKIVSREKQAKHMGKHRRYTLNRFQDEFAQQFGSTIDYRMNRMYDLLLEMRGLLEKRRLI